jgi:hypothetical protein
MMRQHVNNRQENSMHEAVPQRQEQVLNHLDKMGVGKPWKETNWGKDGQTGGS